MPWFGKKETALGFIDDINEHQLEALEDFREEIDRLELTDDPRYNDAYLLRFLRGNNFKVNKAVKMFESFLEWRKEVNADKAMVLYRFPVLKKIKKLYKHGYHKTDLEGRPIWVDLLCQAKVDECLKLTNNEMMMQYYIAEYERLLHGILPAGSKAAGKSVETTFSIIDCKGFKMSLFSKKNREFLNTAANLSQNYYPEIMWQMYVINTPFIFMAAWTMIKPFLNESTRNRIKLLGSKYQNDLFKIVDPDNLPTSVGGNCTGDDQEAEGLIAGPGPWNEYPGDEFGEAAKKEINNDTTDVESIGDESTLSDGFEKEIHTISKKPNDLIVNYNSPEDIDIINLVTKNSEKTAKKSNKKKKKKTKSSKHK